MSYCINDGTKQKQKSPWRQTISGTIAHTSYEYSIKLNVRNGCL